MAWEDEEESFLHENGASMTVVELGKELEPISNSLMSSRKSNETIRAKCKAMGIVPLQDGRRPWTDTEVAFLQENKGRMSTKELATALDRTYRSVVAKCRVVEPDGEYTMKRITPWMPTMLKHIPGQGQSIYDLSVELFGAGKRVEIMQKRRKVGGNEPQQFALMCRVRGSR